MNKSVEQTPFLDLPAALVEEVIGSASAAGDLLLDSLQGIKSERRRYRQSLMEHHLVLSESVLGYPPIPTTCASDGSYAIERLLTADLAAAAAVAVEGLTPPSEKRHWEQPHHSTYVVAEAHHPDTATVLRAVMLGRELLLASRAPHDLVMLDGTLTLPMIYLNQAINLAPGVPELHCSQELLSNCLSYLEAYREILGSQRSDRNHVALPKYSTHREIGRVVGWPGSHDDRGLLTFLLEPGEFTMPQPLEQPGQPWHLSTARPRAFLGKRLDDIAAEVTQKLSEVHVLYYKPHDWLPALRLEVARSIASNKHRLGCVIQGIKHQCATASMLEPYPLYLADRTVKALARSLPAFRQVATQRISDRYDGDLAEVFFAMHGYRSEAGG